MNKFSDIEENKHVLNDVEEELYSVQKILSVAIVDNTIKYRIRWVGYGPEDDTWEPEENLTIVKDGQVDQMLRRFQKKEKERITDLKRRLFNERKRFHPIRDWIYDTETDKLNSSTEKHKDSDKKVVATSKQIRRSVTPKKRKTIDAPKKKNAKRPKIFETLPESDSNTSVLPEKPIKKLFTMQTTIETPSSTAKTNTAIRSIPPTIPFEGKVQPGLLHEQTLVKNAAIEQDYDEGIDLSSNNAQTADSLEGDNEFSVIEDWDDYVKQKEHDDQPEQAVMHSEQAISEEEFLSACKTMDGKRLLRLQASVDEQQFFNYCSLRVPDDSGRNILHWLAIEAQCETRYHRADNIAWIVAKAGSKFLLSQRDSDGKTPLHYALAAKYNCLGRIYLNYNSPVNLVDSNGDTPLKIVFRQNNKSMVQALLEYGACSDEILNEIVENPTAYNVPEAVEVLKLHMTRLEELLRESRMKSLKSVAEVRKLSNIFTAPLMEGPNFHFKFECNFLQLPSPIYVPILAVFCCRLGDVRTEWQAQCYPRFRMEKVPRINEIDAHSGDTNTAMMYPCQLKPGTNKIFIKLSSESATVREYILACYVFLGRLV